MGPSHPSTKRKSHFEGQKGNARRVPANNETRRAPGNTGPARPCRPPSWAKEKMDPLG